MRTAPDTPPWPPEPCPPWCVVRHAPDDHEHDRKHVSTWLTVPAVELEPLLHGAEHERAQAVDLGLCLHRRIGERTLWLYVGDGEHQALELTVDSWSRLLPAVDRLLDVGVA
jgi:hypothetical protein